MGAERLIKTLNAPVTAFLDAVKNGKPVAGLDLGKLTHESKFVVNENGKFLIAAQIPCRRQLAQEILRKLQQEG